MNRIEKKFEELRRKGRKALIGYLTAGDPDFAVSKQNIRAAMESGLDILELGVPFSDPTADGPTIQAAAYRALAAGMSVRRALDMVSELRMNSDLPIVLFGYANPLAHYGYERVCGDAAAAGVDGMLVVDLPFEEADELRSPMSRHGLFQIPLIAPTTSLERARMLLKGAQGFVYYIMVTGVTGARQTLVAGLAQRVGDLKKITPLPVAVGFGVSTGEQAREASEAADGVVVGSALVQAARDGRLAELVRELRTALDAGR